MVALIIFGFATSLDGEANVKKIAGFLYSTDDALQRCVNAAAWRIMRTLGVSKLFLMHGLVAAALLSVIGAIASSWPVVAVNDLVALFCVMALALILLPREGQLATSSAPTLPEMPPFHAIMLALRLSLAGCTGVRTVELFLKDPVPRDVFFSIFCSMILSFFYLMRTPRQPPDRVERRDLKPAKVPTST